MRYNTKQKCAVLDCLERHKNQSLTVDGVCAALDAEGEQILKNLPPRAYKVALCIEGKQLSSEELAALLHDVKETHGEVCFVIGSSHGLAEKVKAACDRRLSFSRLTFPHRLMRVILSEALYRALSIEGGGEYHK